MAANIRTLENLVRRAVDRIQGLSEERDRLSNEVDHLKLRLDDAERAPVAGSPSSEAWPARRQEAVALIRQTLGELRRD